MTMLLRSSENKTDGRREESYQKIENGESQDDSINAGSDDTQQNAVLISETVIVEETPELLTVRASGDEDNSRSSAGGSL